MVFTVRYILGGLLVLISCSALHSASLNLRWIREVDLNKTELTTIGDKLLETTTNLPNEVVDANKGRTENARSLDFDISKFTSPEFHSNVYNLPTSPENEKFVVDDDKSTTYKFSYTSDITTPSSEYFDQHYQQIEQNEFDFSKPSLEELIDKSKNTNATTNLDTLRYTNSVSDVKSDKNSVQESNESEKGFSVDFASAYNDTKIIDEATKVIKRNMTKLLPVSRDEFSTTTRRIFPTKLSQFNRTRENSLLSNKIDTEPLKPLESKENVEPAININKRGSTKFYEIGSTERIRPITPHQFGKNNVAEQSAQENSINPIIVPAETTILPDATTLKLYEMTDEKLLESHESSTFEMSTEASTKEKYYEMTDEMTTATTDVITTEEAFSNTEFTVTTEEATTLGGAMSNTTEINDVVSTNTIETSTEIISGSTESNESNSGSTESNKSSSGSTESNKSNSRSIDSNFLNNSSNSVVNESNSVSISESNETTTGSNETTTGSTESTTGSNEISTESNKTFTNETSTGRNEINSEKNVTTEESTELPTSTFYDNIIYSNLNNLKEGAAINNSNTTTREPKSSTLHTILSTTTHAATTTEAITTEATTEIITTLPTTTSTTQSTTFATIKATTFEPVITTSEPITTIKATTPEPIITTEPVTTTTTTTTTIKPITISAKKANDTLATTKKPRDKHFKEKFNATDNSQLNSDIDDDLDDDDDYSDLTKKVVQTLPPEDIEIHTEIPHTTIRNVIKKVELTMAPEEIEIIQMQPTVKSKFAEKPNTKSPTTTEETELPTEGGSFQNPEEDDNSGTVIAIIISSVGAICLIILAGLLFVMRRRQKRFNYGQRCTPVSLDAYSMDNVSVYNSVRRKAAMRGSKRSYGNPAFDDTSVSNSLNFQALVKFAGNIDEIQTEFDEVPQVTARMNELPEGCDTKNRYANVIPLPETRVFLSPVEDDPIGDYINANYVTGPKGARNYYIACQAPMQNTVNDFWRMIWEQQSKVVMMITHLFENGVEKCIDYLPPSEVLDCHRLFGDYQVTLKNREVKDKYIISSLQLKNMVSNSWREVTHFWYSGWPEKGVPNEESSLIACLIEARSYVKLVQNNSDVKVKDTSNGNFINGTTDVSPVVVHCSPGTGRTGTVIACDIAIREFELKRVVDIPKIVYRIRRDRASSVQTKDQYTFIYKVISLYATKLTGGALDSI